VNQLHRDLEAVSRALQDVHKQIVEAERPYGSSRERVALLDSLLNDPDWAWLRALSKLIADLDESLDEDEELTTEEAEAAAGQVRALVFGVGESRDEAFLQRYRPLLQKSPGLASAHGALKQLVDALPPHRLIN
jgi:hypothetical protein